jgi:hypothetical protein
MTFRVVDARTHLPIERFGIAIHAGRRACSANEPELPIESSGGEAVLAVPHRESSVAVRAPGHALLSTVIEENWRILSTRLAHPFIECVDA